MPQPKRVAIVGVGLIGGSIGLALRQRQPMCEVVGIGRDSGRLEAAVQQGAINRFATDVASGVKGCELVVVCTPVDQVAQHVLQAAEACDAGAIITDVGSSKALLVQEVEAGLKRLTRKSKVHFVGGHPIAGSEKTGAAAGSADLFCDRAVVLTPTANSYSHSVEVLTQFWQDLGARVTCMSPQEHDAALAATSHVPHLIAAAIAGSTPKDYVSLTAGGWLDTTRIAAGSPQLWQQILFSNREPVLAQLKRVEELCSRLRTALENQDASALTQLLTQAKEIRDVVAS